MFSRFLTVSLALAALNQPAFAEPSVMDSGFELRGGASFAYGEYNYDHEGNDYDYNITELDGFLDAGYRFKYIGFYLDAKLGYAITNLSAEGKYDIGNPEGLSRELALVSRLFIPITDQLAFVPHIGLGMNYWFLIAFRVGGGVDYQLTDHLFLTAEASYLRREGVIDNGPGIQTQLGVGYRF